MTRTPRSLWISLLTLLVLVAGAVPTASAQTSTNSALTVFGECDVEADVADKRKTYSLYYENYKQEQFAAALPELRWMLRCAPVFAGPTVSDDRNLERAVKVYEAMAAQSEADQKKAYLDTAYVVIENALPLLEANEAASDNSEFKWVFMKGYFLQSHGQEMAEHRDEVVDAYFRAYKLDPQNIDPYYIDYMLGEFSRKGDMESLMELLGDVQERFGDDEARITLVNKYSDRVPPKERLAFLDQQLEREPDNAELLMKALRLNQEMGNRARMYELGEKLLENSPSADVYRMLGEMYVEDGQAGKAMEMYENLQSTDADLAAEDYYNMGSAQQELGRLSRARSYYRRALEQNSDFGQAHMAIGDLYASAVNKCSGGQLEREDRAVYWLATDYYQKAKSVSSNLASAANTKINTYRNYYPSAEDLFFWDKSAGDRYQVNYGCYSWIGETTTVRKQ